MKRNIFMYAAIFYCSIHYCYAQKRNTVWCFGDSSGIDFSTLSNPIPIITSLNTRGSCASVSDTLGQLLFYSAYDTTSLYAGSYPIKVYDKNNFIMQNGDSMKGKGWYNEIIIVPNPSNDSFYYEFHIGVTTDYGIYYSIIDLTQNGGLGAVVQKNIQLQSFANVDCINAIKHGNGRDWWVIFRESGVSPGHPNNDFYQYLITPSGISTIFVQSVGSVNSTNAGKITFSPSGDKMVYNSYRGMIELYDYNRCSGAISNPITIFQESIPPPYNHFWGCEFSPNGNVLYVTISDDTSYLFQFDLTAANIAASIDTIWSTTYPGEAIGGLKRGPDNKIYESGPYTNPSVFVYPYPDSMRNVYNEYLGVINNPDGLDTACHFLPYSFYLGGKRTYWGLPNNPDYDMPADSGSLCDSLPINNVAQNPTEIKSELFVTYISAWQKLFINAQNVKGKNCLLQLFDISGREVFASAKKTQPPYFTMDVDVGTLASGVYVVTLQSEKEKLVKKFIKE